MAYREQGYLPEAVVNYLVRLGWSHGDQEIFSRADMVEPRSSNLRAQRTVKEKYGTWPDHGLSWRPLGDRLATCTVSQGSESCPSPLWQGVPREGGRQLVTSATGPHKPFCIGSSNSITRYWLSTWPGRAGHCRIMCSGSLRITSDAAVSNTAFCGCVAKAAMPSTLSPSAASAAAFARAAGHGVWRKCRLVGR